MQALPRSYKIERITVFNFAVISEYATVVLELYDGISRNFFSTDVSSYVMIKFCTVSSNIDTDHLCFALDALDFQEYLFILRGHIQRVMPKINSIILVTIWIWVWV